MKVIKVDIKQEVLEIPQNKLDVSFFKASHGEAMIDEGPGFQPLNIERERWEVQEVSTLTFEEPKRYLVRVDDKRIFNDLILISEYTYKRVLHKKLNEVSERCKYEIMLMNERNEREVRRLKSTSWWRRLIGRWED